MAPALADPGAAALRRAGRVTVVMVAMNVVGHTLVDDPGFATFASFGSFALLGFADFAGPLAVRFLLGIGFAVSGGVLVAVGTLASGSVVWSAAVLVAVGFGVTFAGVFGGYAAAGGKGLILATVLAVMVPGGVADISGRVQGWLLAGLVGSVAMVLLWPERPRSRVRDELAELADSVAGLLEADGSGESGDLQAVAQRIGRVRAEMDSALTRPGGPRSRDRALHYILDELGRAVQFLRRIPAGAEPPSPGSSAEALDVSASLLRSSAEVLRSGASAAEVGMDAGVGHLVGIRAAEIDQLRRELDRDAGADRSATGPLERMDALFPVRMITYLSLSVSANALVATGQPPGDTSFEFQSTAPSVKHGPRQVAHLVVATLRTHLRPRSRWFRNSLRVGVALALAAVVADLTEVDHSFWVVLGTLSVLRSSVMDTGASALQSIVGTLVGFLVATALMLLLGDNTAALWVALPVSVFAASYVPSVLGYLQGQAAFTVMVVVLFNLSEPVGWTLALIRVERVALGVAVSVLAAVLLWPRGLSHDLVAAVLDEYRKVAAYARAAIDTTVHRVDPRPDLSTLHHRALAAAAVAESEFGDLMNSRGAKRVLPGDWTRLVSRSHALFLAGDWMRRVEERQQVRAADTSRSAAVQRAAAALAGSLEPCFAPLGAELEVLDRVARGRAAHTTDPERFAALDLGARRQLTQAREALDRMLGDPSWRGELTLRQVMALLWALQWMQFVVDFAADARCDLEMAGDVVAASWWR